MKAAWKIFPKNNGTWILHVLMMTQIHNSKVEFAEQFAVWTTLALMDGLFSVAGDIGTIVANPYGSVPTAGRHRPSCFWAHVTNSFTTRPTVVNLGRSLGLFKGHDSSGKLRNWPVLFWNGQEFKKGSLNIFGYYPNKGTYFSLSPFGGLKLAWHTQQCSMSSSGTQYAGRAESFRAPIGYSSMAKK